MQIISSYEASHLEKPTALVRRKIEPQRQTGSWGAGRNYGKNGTYNPAIKVIRGSQRTFRHGAIGHRLKDFSQGGIFFALDRKKFPQRAQFACSEQKILRLRRGRIVASYVGVGVVNLQKTGAPTHAVR